LTYKEKQYTMYLSKEIIMITIYTRNACPFCDRAKALLESRGVEFKTINIEEHPEAREFLVDGGHRSVPQIFKGNQHIPGGYQGLAGMSEEEFNTKIKGM
jgi:glutaredoxin 3